MLRNATAVLLAAVFATCAIAASTEIPANALAEEARVRAAFTPVQKARVATLEKRLTPKMSVQEVSAMTRGESAETIFAVMMEFLKMCQKEAREKQKAADAMKQLVLAQKDSKIQQENAKIEAQKREAEARFEHAMQAASSAFVLGVVSSSSTMASGAGAMGSGGAGQVPSMGAPRNAGSAAGPTPFAGVPRNTSGLAAPTRTPTPARGLVRN